MENNCLNHWRILRQTKNSENDSQILDNQHARDVPPVRTARFNSLEHEIAINTYKNSVMWQETRFVSIRETNRLAQYSVSGKQSSYISGLVRNNQKKWQNANLF